MSALECWPGLAKQDLSNGVCVQMLYNGVDSALFAGEQPLSEQPARHAMYSFLHSSSHATPLLLSASSAGQDAVQDQCTSLWPPWLKLGKRNYIICRMCKVWSLPPSMVQACDDNAYTEMDKFMATKCGQWYDLKARKWNTLLTVNQ
jgi:hypothetical protein